MKAMKKGLALFLALTMSVSLLSVGASALEIIPETPTGQEESQNSPENPSSDTGETTAETTPETPSTDPAENPAQETPEESSNGTYQ